VKADARLFSKSFLVFSYIVAVALAAFSGKVDLAKLVITSFVLISFTPIVNTSIALLDGLSGSVAATRFRRFS
jgi:hypothetical protein